MNENNSSSHHFSPFRLIIKGAVYLVVVALIFIIALYASLPAILSSDLASRKIVAYLSEHLQRPVSIDSLSFSWTKGVAVSEFKIDNRDQSPLLKVDDFRLLVSWLALTANKIVIKSLNIDGIELAITRDGSGRTSISDLFEPPEKEMPAKKKKEFSPETFPTLFLDAHLKSGNFTFIDQRLDTTTRLSNLTTDLSIHSLTEPIDLLLKGDVILNDKAPESIELTGSALLSSEGKFDPQKAEGGLEMKASFGRLSAFFDLSKFSAPEEATGAKLSCFLDLNKLTQLGAGIVGFPPGFSLKGQLKTELEARGNFQSRISINGETRLIDLSVSGGPFKDTPFKQPHLDFFQDISLNFADDLIEIKAFKVTSNFINLATSGTIKNFQNKPNINLLLSSNGNLHEIVRVIGKMTALPSDLSAAGTMDISLSGQGDLNELTIKGKTVFKNLKIDSPLLKGPPFYERFLELNHDILFNIPQNTLSINSFTIRGESLKADLKGKLDKKKDIDFNLKLATNFANLKKKFRGILPPSFPRQGQLMSEMMLKGNVGKSLSFTGEHTIDAATVILSAPASDDKSSSSSITFSFPRFKVFHDAVYNIEGDNLAVKKLKASSDFLTFEGSGNLSNISTRPFIKAQIALRLDMPKTQKVLRDLLPKELTTQGEGNLNFIGEGSVAASEETQFLSTWNGEGSFALGLLDYGGIGSLKDLHSTEISLNKGSLNFEVECLLNNGPSQFQGLLDFSKTKPEMNINLDGKDIQISQDIKILGYIIPILIISPSGELSGKGNFSVQASWQGTDWASEISRTINGKGKLSLNDGILKSEDVLSLILKALGQPETLQFEELLTNFRLADEKIYNDNIQVNGESLKFGLQGWTSLVYDPSQKGNPMEYTVTGDAFEKSLGKDAQKILSILGGGETIVPVGIGGTVQKPRVSIKMPKPKDLLQGIFGSLQ